MVFSTLRFILPVISIAAALQAEIPDISNLNNCINEVRQANIAPLPVPTFDQYTRNFPKLIADLTAVTQTLPFVYQEAAAKPLIKYLRNLGERRFLSIFNQNLQDSLSQTLKQIIPDAALSILFHNSAFVQRVDAFQEIASDLYASFISEEERVSRVTGRPIQPPTYGVIPPLVKFGNAESGPYTWPCDATTGLLGMRCAIVSLPPAQLSGGLLAWSSLGHETSGHDILHADAGLLDELAAKVSSTLLNTFRSPALATYWAQCIDETASDICGYLHMGPSAGIGLIGYFRSLGNGKLRNMGFKQGPHPVDLLRGYLAAAVAKRLNFADGIVWGETLKNEASKDNNNLFLIDGKVAYPFPVTLDIAIASTEVVAEVIMNSKLNALQGHSLQEIQDWTDNDQAIVQTLIYALKANGQLPLNLRGPGFYAAHVVSAATLAGLSFNENIPNTFNEMLMYLQIMHHDNPLWSKTPTRAALRLLEHVGLDSSTNNIEPRSAHTQLPEIDKLEETVLEEAVLEEAI